jgi:hypothetical protein
MIHLLIDINNFGFIVRENGKDGKQKKNRCGRDALYYVLHYYYPDTFSPKDLSPERIENLRMFGFKIPEWFPVFSGVAVSRVPKVLKNFNIRVFANNKPVNGAIDFLGRILSHKKMSFDSVLELLKKGIENGNAFVIDISAYEAGFGVDHAMFVYGIDDNYAYVIDSHKLAFFEYEKILEDENKYLMRFPLSKLKNRWEKRGILWMFKKE